MVVEPVENSIQSSVLEGADQTRQHIVSLSERMSSALPGYESILHTIHSSLVKSPDIVHLLSDEEIGIIVSGLSRKTGVVISAKENKSSMKKISLADL